MVYVRYILFFLTFFLISCDMPDRSIMLYNYTNEKIKIEMVHKFATKGYRDTVTIDSMWALEPCALCRWKSYFYDNDSAVWRISFPESQRKDTVLIFKSDILDSIKQSKEKNGKEWQIIIR